MYNALNNKPFDKIFMLNYAGKKSMFQKKIIFGRISMSYIRIFALNAEKTRFLANIYVLR